MYFFICCRCPGCYRNFVKLFCAFTCDPQQSDFMARDLLYVYYYINPEFGNGFFNSCKEVVQPSSNSLAWNIFCGDVPVSKCTIQDIYKTLDSNSPFLVSIRAIHVHYTR